MKKMFMLATAALFAASIALADAPKPAPETKSCDKAAACCKKENCDAKDPAKCDRASCKAHKH